MFEFKTFAQFLVEKEKMVQLYGLHAKGQTAGKSFASVVKPASPAKVISVYNGVHFPRVYMQGKRAPSGVVGK